MKKQPRIWRTFERHPLSGEYLDLDGPRFDRMAEVIKERGIANNRKITLHDGKVLDGWQLYRACIVADVKPEFQDVPKKWTPEEYVEAMNDLRRHESAEQEAKRIEARRQRVVEARESGKSIRTIAEEEGVSRGSVENDLKEAPGVLGKTPGPEGGKVTGRDGKSYEASKPPVPKPEAPEPALCNRCSRNHRTGIPVVKGCRACMAAQKEAMDGREPGDDSRSEAEARQRNGAPPKNGAEAFSLATFRELLSKALKEVDKIAHKYGLLNKWGQAGCPQHEGVYRKIGEIGKDVESWLKQLEKSPPNRRN